VDVGVHPRHSGLSAADTPSDQADDVPPTQLGLAHQGGATVAFTGVLGLLPAGADLGPAEPEAGAPGLSPHDSVASVKVYQGHVNFVLDEVEIASRGVLAPAGHPTPDSGAVVVLKVSEHVAAPREASGIDVLVIAKVDPLGEEEDGDVMRQPPRIVVLVVSDRVHDKLFVNGALLGGLAASVILNDPDLQLVSTLDVFELVSSCDDPVCSSRDVVVSVVWYDGTGSNKVVVALQNQTCPWELVRPGFTFANRDIVSRESLATLVSLNWTPNISALIQTALPPRLRGLTGVGPTKGSHTVQL